MIARITIGALLLLSAFLGLSLFRIERSYSPPPGVLGTQPGAVAVSRLHPGDSVTPAPVAPAGYEETAATVSDGQSAYERFNCVGCHQHGGGGIGPALMDDTWIYGSTPFEIYKSIAEGRPNGMPAFGDKIPETQLWSLVAYVRALGALVPSVRLPARVDHLQATPPMDLQEQAAPKDSASGSDSP